MPGAITLTGLSANDPVPGAYLEINFAQGDAAATGSPIEVLLLGNKIAAGGATVDTVVYGPDSPVPLQTEADAIALFGAGSELHRMFRAFTRVNHDTVVRALAVTESGGAVATATCTISGTASGNGTIAVFAYGEKVEAAVASGDDPTAQAVAVKAAVNQMTHWGFTADNVAGALTFTSKQKGLRANQIRIKMSVTSGITSALGALTTETAFANGTTADSNTAALATIAAARYYYIVSAAEDGTQLGALVTQVNSMAAPTTGIRQRVIGASVDTLGNATTIATGRNAARCEIVWQEKSSWPTAELAANHAAIVTLFEVAPNPRTNFIGFGNDAKTQPYWFVPAQVLQSAWPSRASIKSALNNGLIPIAVDARGKTSLVNRITTRSLNGSNNDYRIRAAHKVTICDFFGDDLLAKITAQFSGKRIGNDPAAGQRPPGAEVVTPSALKSAVFSLLGVYNGNDLLQNLETIKANTIVQRETSPTTRISARIPLQPVDNAEQFTIAIDQVA